MIQPISDILALSFMSQFPEMTSEPEWLQVCEWAGKGKKTPLLNLAVVDYGLIVGLFPCEVGKDDISIHACFQHEYRGRYALEAGRDVLDWIWANTDFDKVIAYIEPTHAKRYAALCGLKKRADGLYEVYR